MIYRDDDSCTIAQLYVKGDIFVKNLPNSERAIEPTHETTL